MEYTAQYLIWFHPALKHLRAYWDYVWISVPA
jgi:hypothetical protein